MPCRSSYSVDIDSEDLSKLQSDLDLLTAFACETLTSLEQSGRPIPDIISTWWVQHKAWDKRSIACEASLALLTEEERHMMRIVKSERGTPQWIPSYEFLKKSLLRLTRQQRKAIPFCILESDYGPDEPTEDGE